MIKVVDPKIAKPGIGSQYSKEYPRVANGTVFT
jgi:hypothetical protein